MPRRLCCRAAAVAGLALMWAIVLFLAQEDSIDLPDVVVAAVLAATVTLAALGRAAYVPIKDTLTRSRDTLTRCEEMFDAASREEADRRAILETIAVAVESTTPVPPVRTGLAAVRPMSRRPARAGRPA